MILTITEMICMIFVSSMVVFAMVSSLLSVMTVMASYVSFKFVLILSFVPELISEHSVSFSPSVPLALFRQRLNNSSSVIKIEIKFILTPLWSFFIKIISRSLIHKISDQVLNFRVVHAGDINIQVDLLAINQRLVVEDSVTIRIICHLERLRM